MALRRGLRSQRIVGTTRRKTSWSVGPGGTAGRSSNGSVVYSVGAQVGIDGATLVRTRGELLTQLVTSDAAQSGFPECAFGIAYVNDNAFNVGITAIPTPITDIAWEGWLFHTMFALISTDAVAAATVSHSGSSPTAWISRVAIDSKAMRKVRQTDVCVGVIEVASEVGAAEFTSRLNIRQLFKLA